MKLTKLAKLTTKPRSGKTFVDNSERSDNFDNSDNFSSNSDNFDNSDNF